MANTIYLPDGSMEVLLGADDFQRLIYDRLGKDAEQEVIKLREAADSVKVNADAKVNTDLDSYESSLQSNTAAFIDILEILKTVNVLVSAKRIDKAKISKALKQIEILISNQI